jgi:hypothetical protein
MGDRFLFIPLTNCDFHKAWFFHTCDKILSSIISLPLTFNNHHKLLIHRLQSRVFTYKKKSLTILWSMSYSFSSPPRPESYNLNELFFRKSRSRQSSFASKSVFAILSKPAPIPTGTLSILMVVFSFECRQEGPDLTGLLRSVIFAGELTSFFLLVKARRITEPAKLGVYFTLASGKFSALFTVSKPLKMFVFNGASKIFNVNFLPVIRF